MRNEVLLSIGLPKWPQMRVVGKKIEKEQAFEIIRRTDTFITRGYKYSSNDHRGDLRMANKIGMPLEPKDGGDSKDYMEYFRKLDKWRKDWGAIETEYVHNSWLSSAYIGGPHGWCSPEGYIYYGDHVGKWPDVETILNEWELLANEFDFLELDSVLYDGECGEDTIKPLVRINVNKGVVELLDPNVDGVGMVETWRTESDFGKSVLDVIIMPSALREHHSMAIEMIEYWVSERLLRKYGEKS